MPGFFSVYTSRGTGLAARGKSEFLESFLNSEEGGAKRGL
jgi:hypothetical protein